MEAQGMTGILKFDGKTIEIVRKGFMSAAVGLRGSKKFSIKQITAVQFKPATLFANGYIQFSFLGGEENKGGIMTAAGNENAVMFNQSQQKKFEEIKEKIEKIVYN